MLLKTVCEQFNIDITHLEVALSPKLDVALWAAFQIEQLTVCVWSSFVVSGHLSVPRLVFLTNICGWKQFLKVMLIT